MLFGGGVVHVEPIRRYAYEQQVVDTVREGSDNVWQFLENNPGAMTYTSAFIAGMVVMWILWLKYGRKK